MCAKRSISPLIATLCAAPIFSPDVLPATQLVVPSINGHNPDLKVWPHDVAEAKRLAR